MNLKYGEYYDVKNEIYRTLSNFVWEFFKQNVLEEGFINTGGYVIRFDLKINTESGYCIYGGDLLFFYSEKEHAFEFYNIENLENEISEDDVVESLFRIRCFKSITSLMDFWLIKKGGEYGKNRTN